MRLVGRPACAQGRSILKVSRDQSIMTGGPLGTATTVALCRTGSEQLLAVSPNRTTSPLPKTTCADPLSMTESPAGSTGLSGGGGVSMMPTVGFGGLGIGAQPTPGG